MTTISQHSYSARILDPGGDIPVALVEDSAGEISFDAGRIPHVQGELTIAVEDAMLLEQLDPRDSRRLAIDVAATFPTGARARAFDLGIREAIPDRAAGTVTLTLASDEALLDDFAQLFDDYAPRAHQASMRAVCNYVLGKIGAVLQAGTADADVTAYWPITNLVTNPSLEVDAAGWLAGTGASTLTRTNATAGQGLWSLRWTAAAGESNVVPVGSGGSFYTVTPGRWYVFSFYTASGIARQARAAIQWWTQGGTAPVVTSYGTQYTSNPSGFTRGFVIAQAPPGADRALPYVSTLGNATGNTHYVDMAMFHEGRELVPYFDGATVDSAAYGYDWQGTAHASPSTRTPVVERRPEVLLWRAGDSGMAFLHPLLLATGLRLVCDEQRRWTLRNATYTAPGVQAWRYGVNIETAAEKLSRDDDSWFDAAVYVYVWTDADGIEQTRTDAYALTGTPTKVLRVELTNTPYPGPGRAQWIVKRAQGTGRTVTVSGIPSWTENTDQLLTITLEGTPAQSGIAGTVRYDIAADTVTITSRTTDTPAGSINLLPGTINSLPGTINTL